MPAEVIDHQRGRDAMFRVWHASEKALIIYMHSDGGSIVCAEKAYPIQKGTLCFIGAGKYHYTMPDDSNHYDRSKLFVDPSHLQAILSAIPKKSLSTLFTDEAFVYARIDESVQGNVETVFQEAAQSEEADRDLILFASTVKLLGYLERYSLESVPRAAGLMSLAIEYINSNLLRELSIDGICAAIHISKYYFCHRFKEEIGMTVMEYVLKTRLVMAKELLRKEKISVTEVAARCGFSGPSYFSRVFKEDTGMTPLAYRKGHTPA